jgi:hypothetical protein
MHYQNPDPELSRYPVCFGDHTEPRTATLAQVTCLICRRLATEDTAPLSRMQVAIRGTTGARPPLSPCEKCGPPAPHGLALADEILSTLALLNRLQPVADSLQSPVGAELWMYRQDLPRIAAALLGACTGCVSHHDPLVVMRRLYERALLAEEEAKTLRGAG